MILVGGSACQGMMGAFSSCLLSLNLKTDAFSSSLGRKHVLEKNTGMHLVPKQEVNFYVE